MRQKKKVKYLLIVLLVGVACLLLFGTPTFWELLKRREEEKFLQNRREQLKAENVHLQKQIETLQKDSLAIERIARQELGMLKPGEIEYRFETNSKIKNQNAK